MDFWLGDWELTWPGNSTGDAGHGTNSIKRILDGCIVEENFSGGESMHLRGRSVSIFEARAGRWKQKSYLVDGGDNNNAFFSQARGRYRAPYQFSNEVVQEFRVS